MTLRAFKVVLLLLLGLVCADLTAQTEALNVVKNEPVTYTFLSRVQPVIGRSPNQGTAVIAPEEGVEFSYVLTYTPEQDYVGSDNFVLVSFPFGLSVAFITFDVDVQEATVRARHDFAATPAGEAVTVAVLDNDTVNIGGMTLTTAPVVNGGTVEVVDDQIIFTPTPGFSGIADFNYVVCSDFGACDLGTVSINVAGTGTSDTVRVFTRRDEAQFIFAPADAEATAEPVNGRMVDLDGVMGYLPNENFVGDETLTYVTPDGGTTTFEVTVLDLEPHVFSVEDRAYTTVDQPIQFNVLRNDLYGVFTDCISYNQPTFGLLREGARTGEVIYVPPTGWTGVDEFTYSSKAPGCGGDAELQTAYIFVSDFTPASEETVLTTPVGFPARLTYDVPGDAATWTVLSSPTQGTIVTDPATGQLSYLPNPGSEGQTDRFNLRYCLTGGSNGECAVAEIVPVTINIIAEDPNGCADEDCVWPGDTNNDGVVDVDDLLPIGLAMGASGTPRPVLDPTAWSAQYGADWGEDLNGLDYKFIDANGDRFISAADTQVVMDNLGLGHRLRAEQLSFTDFDLNIFGPTEAEPGDLLQLEVVAGNSFVVVEDVFGFRFAFQYDPTVIEPTTVGLDFDQESWIAYDSPILALTKNDPDNGVLTAAFTRTSRDGISGFGQIATFNVVVEDVFGFRETYEDEDTNVPTITTTFGAGPTGTTVTNAAGHTSAVRVNPFDLKIKQRPATDAGAFPPAVANDFLDGKLLAFPNPTANTLTVHLNGQQTFTDLKLVDLTGRLVLTEGNLQTNHRELDLSTLPNGIYTLVLTTEDGVVNRKVEVLR